MIVRTLFVILAAIATRASAAPGLIAAYNENSQPADGYYWPYSIGWLWEAPTNFTLTSIETIFAFGDKTVGIHVYDGLPHLGGSLLASATYDAIGGTWGGADLGPVPMTAGEQYLIGFTNVQNLGTSFSEGLGSTLFSADGYAHYDHDSDPPASYEESFFGQANARIRIYGVPEPSSVLFGMAGLIVALLSCRMPRASYQKPI